MNEPAFSVLMPAYEAAEFVGEAIESVLRQTRPPLEILVVDDGSEDATSDVVQGFRSPTIRLWRRANGGRAAAINFMLGQAQGSHVVLQDADDLSAPARLERLAEMFRARPDLAAVMSGHALLIGGRVVAPRGENKSPERCRAEALAMHVPAHDPTLACRTEVARELGFEESLRVGAGLDFVLRLAEAHPMAVIGESLYSYRVNSGSVTRTRIERRAASVRRVLDRARARRGLPPLGDAAFCQTFPATWDPTNNLIGHFVESAWCQAAAGNRLGALLAAFEGLRSAPLSTASVKPFVYALAPTSLARSIRGRRRTARAVRALSS